MTNNKTDESKKSNTPINPIKGSPLKAIFAKKWFTPVLFLFVALLYFSPTLGFNKIIMGTDDGPRGWYTIGNHGYANDSFLDKWSWLNGGTATMERRFFGRFINPTYLFHMFMQKYKARVFEYIFWTFIAGFFMFLFLRTLNISRGIAYVCGIAYMLAPGMQSYPFAGHFAKMEVIALLPGLMFFIERMLKKASLVDILGLTTLMSLCVYSEHLQLAYFSYFGMGCYFAIRMIHMVFITKKITLAEGSKRTGFFAITLVIFTFLTSMNTIPIMHHADVTSKRAGGVDYEYASSYSLHKEEMINLFEPDFIGWKEFYWGQNALKLNSEYFGICFLVLAIMLFVLRKQRFKHYVFAGLFLFGILFSLGGHTPVHRILYHILPGIKSFRGPSMMYIWFFLSGIVLAAYAIEQLMEITWESKSVLSKRLSIFAGIIAGFALIYLISCEGFLKYWYNSMIPVELQNDNKMASMTHNVKYAQAGALFIFLFVGAFFTITYLKLRGKINGITFLVLLLGVSLCDLCRVSYPFLTKCLKPANYYKRQEEVEQSIEKYLHKRDNSIYRVHSIMGDMKMYIPGLEMTYIFDDFTNQRYNDIIERLRPAAYALMQPQYANNPTVHNSFRNILSLLNTKYIIALTNLKITGLKEIVNSGGLRIYQNLNCFPRYFLVSDFSKEGNTKEALFKQIDSYLFNQNSVIVDKTQWKDRKLNPIIDSSIVNKVDVVKYDPDLGHSIVEIESNREQLLVVSENNTTGWTATINKKPSEILSVNHYAKGIIVPQGKSRVELVYNSEVAQRWRNITGIAAILFLFFALYVGFVEFRNYKSTKK